MAEEDPVCRIEYDTVQRIKEDAPIKRYIEPEDIKFPMINEKSKPIP